MKIFIDHPDSTCKCNPCWVCRFSGSSVNASADVRYPSTRMGRLSVSSTISWTSRAMPGSMTTCLSRYRRINRCGSRCCFAARTVGVGEVYGHAQPVPQTRVSRELSAVVVRDADPGPVGSRENMDSWIPDAFVSGPVRDDVGHEEPGLPFGPGVQVAARPDDAVVLPMAEHTSILVLERPLADRRSPGDCETRHLTSAAPAPVDAGQTACPPVPP